MKWIDSLKADYPHGHIDAHGDCTVCRDDVVCQDAVGVLVDEVAEVWEGDPDDVAAWAYINHVNLAGQPVADSQEQFVAYRESVARADRALLETEAPPAKPMPDWLRTALVNSN